MQVAFRSYYVDAWVCTSCSKTGFIYVVCTLQPIVGMVILEENINRFRVQFELPPSVASGWIGYPCDGIMSWFMKGTYFAYGNSFDN